MGKGLHILSDHLSHIFESQKADILKIPGQYPKLFRDVLRQIPMIQHDIDVEHRVQIKHHPYCVSPVKQAVLKEVEYMLENDFAEPGTSVRIL